MQVKFSKEITKDGDIIYNVYGDGKLKISTFDGDEAKKIYELYKTGISYPLLKKIAILLLIGFVGLLILWVITTFIVFINIDSNELPHWLTRIGLYITMGLLSGAILLIISFKHMIVSDIKNLLK